MSIAVQAREQWMSESAHYRSGHFWLARVVDPGTQHFFGAGVVRQITARRETIQCTLFTEGDIVIAVEWLDRVPEDQEGLTFVNWKDPNAGQEGAPSYGVVNSTELRAIDIPLNRRPPSVMPVLQPPPVRRSGRLAGVVEPLVSDASAADAVFELMPDSDARTRAECW